MSWEYIGLITNRIDLGYKKPAQLLVLPDKGLEAEMYKDGIIPKTITYTLTNPGHEPLDFQIGKKEEWVSLSLNKGTLDPGASTKVTVTLNQPRDKKKNCFFKDKITFKNLTNNKGDTSRKVEMAETQAWQVDLHGFEMNVIDPSWKKNKPRKDLKMKFKFSGKFKVKRNEKCKWRPSEERITKAEITDYKIIRMPEGVINIKKKTPYKFNNVTRRTGKKLFVTVIEENVRFMWGSFAPGVRVTETLTPKGCSILPKDCGEEWDVHHDLYEFQTQIAFPWMPLKDGYSGMFPGADRNYGRDSDTGEIWIQYTYTLKQLR